MQKNDLPIGVFDSGLGGLTAVREIKKILPREHVLYFGDTGRLPYGTRSPEIIKKYASSVYFCENAQFLLLIDSIIQRNNQIVNKIGE